MWALIVEHHITYQHPNGNGENRLPFLPIPSYGYHGSSDARPHVNTGYNQKSSENLCKKTLVSAPGLQTDLSVLNNSSFSKRGMKVSAGYIWPTSPLLVLQYCMRGTANLCQTCSPTEPVLQFGTSTLEIVSALAHQYVYKNRQH